MLLDILKEKRCFKLICGAGNEDITETEKLVALYSKAGCNFFDICAKPEIIEAAKNGLKRAGITKDRYLCCSVGVNGDIHTSKAIINAQLCKACGACVKICPQNAIIQNPDQCKINEKKCIGCGKCIKICPSSCIEAKYKNNNLKEILPDIIKQGIDCIELHAAGDNTEEIYEKWNELNEFFSGVLSICINRSKFGNEKVLEILEKLLEKREPYSTVIQADGSPMSGGTDDYKTTLQTVAMAEMIQNKNFPAYFILSGGTNSKTTELAKLCGINISGVGIGSYARKIVKEYTERNDFFENEAVFNKALETAEKLVSASLDNIK